MKKVIIGMILLTTSYSLWAQQTAVYRQTSSTYSTPEPIRVNFQTYYPEAVLVTWEPSGEWWHATYKGDNRINHVYYSTLAYYIEHPVNYKVSLPVLNTYVPERVTTAAINSYGGSLYSITTMKADNGAEIYQVCLMENGTPKTVWMNAESTVFTDVNKIKADNDKLKVKMEEEK
jgi:hypothetical protein